MFHLSTDDEDESPRPETPPTNLDPITRPLPRIQQGRPYGNIPLRGLEHLNVNYRYELTEYNSPTDKYGIEWKYHRARKRGPAYNIDGMAEVHVAADGDLVDALKLLLTSKRHGIKMRDLPTRDRRRLTPLHVAARRGNLRSIKILLDAGADRTILDGERHTVNEAAIFNHGLDVVRYMYMQDPLCGWCGMVQQLLVTCNSTKRGERIGAIHLLVSMTHMDYTKKQTDSLDPEFLGWYGKAPPSALSSANEKEKEDELRRVGKENVCKVNPTQKKFAGSRDITDIAPLDAFKYNLETPDLPLDSDGSLPEVFSSCEDEPEATTEEGEPEASAEKEGEPEVCAEKEGEEERQFLYPEVQAYPDVSDTLTHEHSIYDLVQDKTIDYLMGVLLSRKQHGIHDETASLIWIVENCLRSRFGRWRLCTIQQENAEANAKRKQQYRGNKYSVLNILLSCVHDVANEEVQTGAIHALGRLLSCKEEVGLWLRKSFCCDVVVLSIILTTIIASSYAKVKVSGLTLMNKVIANVPQRIKYSLLESSIVTKVLSNTLRFQGNSSLQMQSNYLMDSFVTHPRMASMLLQNGLLDAMVVICSSVVATVRDYATNSLNVLAHRVPRVVWTHLQDKHKIERKFVKVGISYLESFINIVRAYREEDRQAKLLMALWRAAGGKRNNEFCIYKTAGSGLLLQLMTLEHRQQCQIALQGINELLRITTAEQRAALREKHGLHVLLRFFNHDTERLFREMAITAIGSVCVDPGMVPSSKTQSYLLEFTEAVEFLCNEWKSHYQSEPAKVLPVVYALACMAHKHFPIQRTVRRLTSFAVPQMCLHLLETMDDTNTEQPLVDSTVAVLESLAISVFGRPPERNYIRVTNYYILAPTITRLLINGTQEQQVKAAFAGIVLQNVLEGYEGTKSSTTDALICLVNLMQDPDIPKYSLLYVCRCVRDILLLRCGLGRAMVAAGIMPPLMAMLRSASDVMTDVATNIVIHLIRIDGTALRHLLNGGRLDSRIMSALLKCAPPGSIDSHTVKKWIDVLCYGLPPASYAAALVLHDQTGRRQPRTTQDVERTVSAYSVDARYLPVTPVELPTEVQVAEAIRNDVACQIRLRRSMPLLDIPLPPRQKPRNRHPLASTSGTLDSRHSHEIPSSGFSSSSGSPLSMEYSST